MLNDLQLLKEKLKQLPADSDIDSVTLESENKLTHILSVCPDDDHVEEFDKLVSEILDYKNASEFQRRKLLLFCVDFNDPMVKDDHKFFNDTCEEVQLHSFLNESEFAKLYRFVKKHKFDNTFAETVDKIMNKHQTSPPQVYKSAYLRRQDFSRATNYKSKSATRHIVWQIIIGLKCNIEEADELLFSAGFVRRNNSFDLIMEFFIENKNYDILAINDVLAELNLKPFSCYKDVKDSDNR